MYRTNKIAELEDKKAELQKLRFISEAVNRANRAVIENEVQKRLDKHRQFEEIKLTGRRQRLLDLFLCEARLEQSLTHKKLHDEKASRRSMLMEEAKHYQQLVKSKNKELAQSKYDLQFHLNSPELRNRKFDLHTQVIHQDRAEIQRMKEQDALREAEWERQILAQKSHLDEQFDREDEVHAIARAKAFDLARDNLRANQELKQRQEEEKQAQLREEKDQLEKLKYENDQQSKIDCQARREQLQQLRQEVENHRKYRADELNKEKITETYCCPTLKPESRQDRRADVKRLHNEQMQFLNFKKEMERRDQCLEQYVDQQYMDMARNRDREYCARRKLERAKFRAMEKETLEHNRKAYQLKIDKEKEERLERIKMAEECRRKQEELEKQIKKEEELIRQKSIEYSKQLYEQKEATRQRKEHERRCEVECDRRKLEDTEFEYQAQVERLTKRDPFGSKLHPLRKHSMGMADLNQC